MEWRSANRCACVPFPAPGGPNNISLIVSFFTPRIFDFLNKQPFVLRMVTLFERKCRTGTPFKNGKRVFKFANTGKPPGN